MPTQAVRAYHAIRALIQNQTFGSDAVLAEFTLGARLGISRTPVREAFHQLEFEGLIRRRHDGRYHVMSFSVSDVEDVVSARTAIEGLALRMALSRGVSYKLMARAHELLSCMDACIAGHLDDHAINTYLSNNNSFHSLLAEMSGSEMVRRHLDHMSHMHFGDPSAFVRARGTLSDARTSFLIAQEQHGLIIQALQNREESRLMMLLSEHGRGGCRAMAHAVGIGQSDQIEFGHLIMRTPQEGTRA